MTVDSLHVQQGQHGHESTSGYTEGIYSRFLPNASAQSARCAGMFTAVKEYFWPTTHSTEVIALTDWDIVVESARKCNAKLANPEQGTRYGSAFKCIGFVATAAGIAATAYWVRLHLMCRDGDTVELNGLFSEALYVAYGYAPYEVREPLINAL